MKQLTTTEIEQRMRPNSWSRHGFLGQTESLPCVIEQDALTLAKLGIAHVAIADYLEKVLLNVLQQKNADLISWFSRMASFPNFEAPMVAPHFSLDNLPDISEGYIVGNLHLFITQWRSFQVCPWGCPADVQLGSIDFLILNRKTGESFTGPGLIVHLIREHHFFEGQASLYRVDPAKAVRVLELG